MKNENQQIILVLVHEEYASQMSTSARKHEDRLVNITH